MVDEISRQEKQQTDWDMATSYCSYPDLQWEKKRWSRKTWKMQLGEERSMKEPKTAKKEGAEKWAVIDEVISAIKGNLSPYTTLIGRCSGWAPIHWRLQVTIIQIHLKGQWLERECWWRDILFQNDHPGKCFPRVNLKGVQELLELWSKDPRTHLKRHSLIQGIDFSGMNRYKREWGHKGFHWGSRKQTRPGNV